MLVSSFFFTMSPCLLLCHSFIRYSFFLTLPIKSMHKQIESTHTLAEKQRKSYARWQSSLRCPLWRWWSRWARPERAESETSSWSPWPWCWAPPRSLAWGRSCLLPVGPRRKRPYSQPYPTLPWTFGSSQPLSAPDSLGRKPASQLLPQPEQQPSPQSGRGTVTRLAQSKGQPETG